MNRLKERVADTLVSCLLQIGMTDTSGHRENLQLVGGPCMQEWVEFDIGFSFNQESEVSGFRAGTVQEMASLRSEASFDSTVPGEGSLSLWMGACAQCCPA